MKQLLLTPSDILFFRDGRPMEGGLSGHGAAWPLPHLIANALHAALWRAFPNGMAGEHKHRLMLDQQRVANREDAVRFGSLRTAGPFPVNKEGQWFVPAPGDVVLKEEVLHEALCPVYSAEAQPTDSSLHPPLRYTLGSTLPPSKDNAVPRWISTAALSAWLRNGTVPSKGQLANDTDVADAEHSFGIGIDAATDTVAEGKFYSASYLRLREAWNLGALVDAFVEGKGEDPLGKLFAGEKNIIVGGQQRVCGSVVKDIMELQQVLPVGKTNDFKTSERKGETKWHVKWVLLSPAIWPEMKAGKSKRGTQTLAHAGGWLPNWIDPGSGRVLLQSVSAEERKRRRKLNYSGKGYTSESGATSIAATLVAASIPKPIPVTGYAMPNATLDERGGEGAQSTHLAVPAGAVYFFEADSETDAKDLAASLNWHQGNDTNPATLRNRRSTLLGEKGFGLGVCGTWEFHPYKQPHS